MQIANQVAHFEDALALLRGRVTGPLALSRRHVMQGLLLGAAGMALSPASVAQIEIPPGQIRLIFNENPYGPSPKALAEVARILPLTAYYPDDIEGELIALLMERLQL
ncbi:MAG: hypothetical protein VW202_13055, partial [Halieaceae bacterium]